MKIRHSGQLKISRTARPFFGSPSQLTVIAVPAVLQVYGNSSRWWVKILDGCMMNIVLGGYLETALIRYSDVIQNPDRNRSFLVEHLCCNRPVSKSFFDRAATFIALADNVYVDTPYWGVHPSESSPGELDVRKFGVSIRHEYLHTDQAGSTSWDLCPDIFANLLLRHCRFSSESWLHMSTIDVSHFQFQNGADAEAGRADLSRRVAKHFLGRLFYQLRAANETGALLVLSEPDIKLVQEISLFLAVTKMPTPFDFPDLTGSTVNADNFAAGLLNFSPADALSLVVVKQDKEIKKYAAHVSQILTDAGSEKGQHEILKAMREAHESVEVYHRAEKIFEIAGWAVKPLHYIPVVGEALTLTEDVKDVINAWMERESGASEWYLIGAKMQDVSVSEYLSRKGNVGR